MADTEAKIEASPDSDPTKVPLPTSQESTSDVVEKAPAALLVILGEVHNAEQRDLVLQRLVDGLLSWDVKAAGCDVEEELNKLVKLQPKGVADSSGETVFQYKSEALQVDVLVNARFQTLQKKLHLLLLTHFRYRFVLFSGLTLLSSGGWFLQDGHFSLSSLSEVFHRQDVLQAVAKQQNSNMDVSVVAEVGDWTAAALAKLNSRLKVRLNPPKVEKNADGILAFSNFILASVRAPSCADLLVSTTSVKSLSQIIPTVYVFPAGHGDSALFALSGFSLLLDGGYGRRSCFWEIARILQSLDATILTHLGPDNIFGIESFLEKRVNEKGFPELGVVYSNTCEAKHVPANDKSQGLLVSLVDKGVQVLDKLHRNGTPLLPCLGVMNAHAIQPINVYHKVGHGSVDLYILNPMGDHKDTRELLSGWAKNLTGNKGGVPTLDYLSVCALVVWKPVSPNERPVRILFPGNTPQAKIFEGCDLLKHVGILQSSSGITEKCLGTTKGHEKSTAAGGKMPLAAKGKPPAGPKTEAKDAKKPAGELKSTLVEQNKSTLVEQNKETKKPAESKDAKKTAEQKESKKPAAADTKNGKASARKDTHVKGVPSATKNAKKAEGDTGKKKAVSKKATAAAGAQQHSTDTEEASAFPLASETAEPIIGASLVSEGAVADDMSQVQALPEPLSASEEIIPAYEEAEKGIAEQEERESSGKIQQSVNGRAPDSTDDSTGKNSITGANKAAFDPVKEWGIPDGLPAPANGKEPGAAKKAGHNVSVVGATASGTNSKKEDAAKATETTAKASTKRPMTAPDRLNNTTHDKDEKTAANQSLAKGRPSITGVSSARGEPKKLPLKPVVPVYVDVAYIPGHGNLSYFDVDFFRRIRARNYVLSSVAPNPKVFALLIEGKQTWEDSSAEVSLIPTYDSESLISWLNENRDQLHRLNIKVEPPACKCIMQVQEIDTSCAAFRLEF